MAFLYEAIELFPLSGYLVHVVFPLYPEDLSLELVLSSHRGSPVLLGVFPPLDRGGKLNTLTSCCRLLVLIYLRLVLFSLFER